MAFYIVTYYDIYGGSGSIWLEHCPVKARIAGSNPVYHPFLAEIPMAGSKTANLVF